MRNKLTLSLHLMRYIIQLLIVFALLCTLCQSCLIDKTDDEVLISGIIKDSAGNGIAGVKVTLESLTSNITAETSSTGHYSLNVPSAGTAYIFFSKEGYTPQSKTIAYKGGENLAVNMSLNSLSEDAYFTVKSDDVQLRNTSGFYSILVETNISFEVECDADWLNIKKEKTYISFDYTENKTIEKRTATITFKAEYNITKTIKVVQDAGVITKSIDSGGEKIVD